MARRRNSDVSALTPAERQAHEASLYRAYLHALLPYVQQSLADWSNYATPEEWAAIGALNAELKPLEARWHEPDAKARGLRLRERMGVLEDRIVARREAATATSEGDEVRAAEILAAHARQVRRLEAVRTVLDANELADVHVTIERKRDCASGLLPDTERLERAAWWRTAQRRVQREVDVALGADTVRLELSPVYEVVASRGDDGAVRTYGISLESRRRA